jgi:hypothetical protein
MLQDPVVLQEEDEETPEQQPEEREVDRNAASMTDAVRDRLFKSRTLIISGEINQRLVSQRDGPAPGHGRQSATTPSPSSSTRRAGTWRAATPSTT